MGVLRRDARGDRRPACRMARHGVRGRTGPCEARRLASAVAAGPSGPRAQGRPAPGSEPRTREHRVRRWFAMIEPIDEQQGAALRERALTRLKKKSDFHAHVFVYLLVNTFLVGIWFFTGHGYFWPIFPILG